MTDAIGIIIGLESSFIDGRIRVRRPAVARRRLSRVGRRWRGGRLIGVGAGVSCSETGLLLSYGTVQGILNSLQEVAHGCSADGHIRRAD